MPLFRFGHSWDPLRNLEQEVDQLLQTVNWAFHGIRLGRQYPAINLYETPEEFLLTAELPGVQPDDLELTLSGGVLVLKGQRGGPEEVPEQAFRRSERFRGAWQRSIALPERVREEELRAGFTDGVLRVWLPKGTQPPARQIRVTDGEPSAQPFEATEPDAGEDR